MKQYEFNERHDRVYFSPKSVITIRAELMALSNTHPTFLSIREKFLADEVNISAKQVEVLNRSLAADGRPSLSELTQISPFAATVVYRGSPEAAVRVVMAHLECGTYGDWTYSADFQTLPGGMKVLEVGAASPVYFGFRDLRDLDTANIALESPGWL